MFLKIYWYVIQAAFEIEKLLSEHSERVSLKFSLLVR